MTVIAGYTDGKTWAIASDSGLFEDGDNDTPSGGIYFRGTDPKVWRNERSLMGMSGTSAVDEIARKSGIGDPYKLRDALKASEVSGAWILLVVTQKGLYYLSDDFSVIPLKNKYSAIGIACQPALGSLDTSNRLGIAVDRAVRLAVTASMENSIYAVPPIVSRVLKDNK